MGTKTHAIYRRLNIPNYKWYTRPNTFILPKNLRIESDLFSWDRPVPTKKPFDDIRDFMIKDGLKNFLYPYNYELVRTRLRESDRFLHIHAYIFDKNLNFEHNTNYMRNSFYTKKGWVRSKFFEKRMLNTIIKKYNCVHKPLVLTFYNINNYIGPNEYKHSIDKYKNYEKQLVTFKQGIAIVNILPANPVMQLLGDWLAKVFIEEKRPLARLTILQDIFNNWGDPVEFNQPIQGITITVRGRIGGVDKALHQKVIWGTVPRETLSAGIVQTLREAHTSYGVLGITIQGHYR